MSGVTSLDRPLVMTGWVAAAPTGHAEAFLMLTTPSPAVDAMTAVAAGLGLTPGQVAETDRAHVTVSSDGWATLVTDDQRFTRKVNPTWRVTALQRRQVVLVVGIDPMPEGMDPDTYTDRHGPGCALGMVPCWAV